MLGSLFIGELQKPDLILRFRGRDRKAVARLIPARGSLAPPSSGVELTAQERLSRSRGLAEIGQHAIAVDDVSRDVTLRICGFRATDLFLISGDEIRESFVLLEEAHQHIGIGCELMIGDARDQATRFDTTIDERQLVLRSGRVAAPSGEKRA